MQEAIRINHERALKIEAIKRAKREQKKEWILFTIIASFILIITINLLNKQTDEAMKNCQKKGFAYNVCAANLN